jgi:hypothetical protein
MADIFISYAREDLRWASHLVQALNSYGWSIWWDPETPPGKEYDEIIEKELSTARCIIVAWSKNSIRSRWVKEEAQEGIEQEKIIPVLVEEVKAPLGFRSLHHIDLTAWDETVNSPQLEALVKQLEKTLGPTPHSYIPQEEYRRVQEFFIKLLDYDTGLSSTIVRVIRQEGSVISADLFRANPRAYRFFGYASEPEHLAMADLLQRVSLWVNPHDLHEFRLDQMRLGENLILGLECHASVPLRINDRHPYHEFRDQSFMPIIVAFSGKFAIHEHVEELIFVTYINISVLCQHL